MHLPDFTGERSEGESTGGSAIQIRSLHDHVPDSPPPTLPRETGEQRGRPFQSPHRPLAGQHAGAAGVRGGLPDRQTAGPAASISMKRIWPGATVIDEGLAELAVVQ